MTVFGDPLAPRNPEPTRFELLDKEMAGRLPPWDLSLEMAVLGAMLRDYDAVTDALRIVEPDDFYRPAHRRVCQAIVDLSGDGSPVDLATVAVQLETSGDLDKCGGRASLVDIADSVFTAANIVAHSKLVREYSIRRRVIRKSNILTEMAYERASIDDLYSLYLETGEPFNIGKDAARFVGKGAFAAVHSGLGPMKKIGSGFPSLDRKLAEGFIPNTVSVLFGRPSSGKSALRSNMAVNMCVAGMGVLVLSTETPVRSEMNRLLSIKTGYDYDVVSSWYELRGEDAERDAAIERAIREIDKVWHLYSAYDKMMSAHDVLNWLRKSKQQGPVNVVFIDRFDLLVEVSSCVNSAEKSAVIKKVLQTMSGLAESENVHVCCVAQQRRAQGSSSKKNAEEYGQGSIDSVGESRSYEEAADLMLSPHRPGKYDRDLPDNTMNITIGKQREGEAGAGAFVVLGWEGSTRRVYELTDDRGEN